METSDHLKNGDGAKSHTSSEPHEIKMKKVYSLFTAICIGVSALAQIPNADFENWTSVGNYEDPDGWTTMNFLSVPNGHTNCTKSTDHVLGGNFSMKITSNTSLDQNHGGFGIVATGGFNYPFEPAFPVSANPTALTFYYKTEMFNDDSGQVVVVLFNQGNVISQHGEALPPTTSWTPYVLDIETVGTADSATIVLFAYAPEGPNDAPNGNSSIWVDHLNWDELISGVDESEADAIGTDLYPNPASDHITVRNLEVGDVLTIYDMAGQLIMSRPTFNSLQNIEIGSLSKGMYLMEVNRGNSVGRKTFVVE